MKTCGKCKVDKPLDAYAKSASKGYQSYCRDCNREHKRAWLVDNRATVAKNRLWSMYRLRQEDYDQMFSEQDGKCAICTKDFQGVGFVDHDHNCCPNERSCGKCVRGLLCSPCNARLGWYENNKDQIGDYMMKLGAYVHDHS